MVWHISIATGHCQRSLHAGVAAITVAVSEFMRVALQHVGRGSEPDYVEDAHGFVILLLPGQLGPVQLQAAHHAVRDAEDRVEGSERILEDHGREAAVPELIRS